VADVADKTAHRPHRRYVFPAGAPVSVELPGPLSGPPRKVLPLLDLSATGLSFAFGPGDPACVPGDTLDGVVVRVGRHCIAGSLRVVRVDAARVEGWVCGASFHPASERADAALRGVLAWLDAQDSRPAGRGGSRAPG